MDQITDTQKIGHSHEELSGMNFYVEGITAPMPK